MAEYVVPRRSSGAAGEGRDPGLDPVRRPSLLPLEGRSCKARVQEVRAWGSFCASLPTNKFRPSALWMAVMGDAVINTRLSSTTRNGARARPRDALADPGGPWAAK